MKNIYLCMPLKENVPEAEHKGWKLTKCVICGAECWESKIATELLKNGAIRSCTKCALKVMINHSEKRRKPIE